MSSESKVQSQGSWDNTSPDDFASWCAGRRRDARQARVFEWANAAFTEVQATSLPQRSLRLLEEAIELYQACGGDMLQAGHLLHYVFGRPPGQVGQELGGVGVCVLALAAAAGLSADAEERREAERVLSKPPAHWAARNKAKNDAGFRAADTKPLRQHDGSYLRDGRSDDQLRDAIKTDLHREATTGPDPAYTECSAAAGHKDGT